MSNPQRQPQRFWMLPMDAVMQKLEANEEEKMRKAKEACLAKANQPRPQLTGEERVIRFRRQMGLE